MEHSEKCCRLEVYQYTDGSWRWAYICTAMKLVTVSQKSCLTRDECIRDARVNGVTVVPRYSPGAT